jgi:hypothetical protein
MAPPTNIDGTEITGATIDGQDVTQITIDGTTVFSATPVALSNLIAWYPFDPSAYAGMSNNADDATDGLAGAGNQTAFDATVNGATYQSSGGTTDVEAGANSGAFDFDGSNDFITLPQYSAVDTSSDFSVSLFLKPNVVNSQNIPLSLYKSSNNRPLVLIINNGVISGLSFDGSSNNGVQTSISAGQFTHIVYTYDSSAYSNELFKNGSKPSTSNNFQGTGSSPGFFIGKTPNRDFFDGVVDDVRFYDRKLTSAEVSRIFQNTKP